MDDSLINKCLKEIDDEDRNVRINAINILGDSCDELILAELRVRLKEMTPEHQALIIAVAKLKKDLGIK
jgi:hypothetical protein